ncbi:MAG: hypothetical protein HOV87_04720 [Catenulispora sp.]|nr:hypothetical protein [Catenulispora sp.]
MTTFGDFPINIQRQALLFLGEQQTASVPETSRVGSEGSESTESSESTERSEHTETTESSETTERKEMKEKEREWGLSPALNAPAGEPLTWKPR